MGGANAQPIDLVLVPPEFDGFRKLHPSYNFSAIQHGGIFTDVFTDALNPQDSTLPVEFFNPCW
jgi:hypothetical protein